MCEINWTFIAALLSGAGDLLLGVAAISTLFIQYGYRSKSKHLETSLKLLLNSYRRYMASEEGIVWSDYPKNAELIIAGVSRNTGLEQGLVRDFLDQLKAEGKL
jgi:hypothetical protein